LLLLRGDLIAPDAIVRAANENLRAYGFPGVSMYAAEPESVDDAIHRHLRRLAWIVVFSAGDLRSSGLELWLTGRWPHYDAVCDTVDVLVERLVSCPHRVIKNHRHDS
jgi:hypothetical protein